MNKKKLIKTGLISAVIFTFCCCSKTTPENKETSKDTTIEFQQTVETVTAKKMPQEKSLVLTGKVDYDLDNVANYTSLVNGIIVKSSFSMGNKVQKGQTLLEIKSSELNNLQSEVIAAQTDLKVAQREYQSSKELYDDNMLSQKELYEAEARLKQAEALAKKLEQDQGIYGSNVQNGLYVIKAPISGYIVEKGINGTGSIVSEGELLFTVADLSSVWVMANVYAGSLADVKDGQQVEVTCLSYPNEIFHGFIDSMSPTFDNEEKVIKAKIKMKNEALKLKPEMSVSIKIKEITPVDLIGIPSSALIFDNNKYFIIIADKNKEYTIQQVVVDSHNNDTSYIYGDVKAGDEIVVKNQLLIYSKLKDQQKDA